MEASNSGLSRAQPTRAADPPSESLGPLRIARRPTLYGATISHRPLPCGRRDAQDLQSDDHRVAYDNTGRAQTYLPPRRPRALRFGEARPAWLPRLPLGLRLWDQFTETLADNRHRQLRKESVQ